LPVARIDPIATSLVPAGDNAGMRISPLPPARRGGQRRLVQSSGPVYDQTAVIFTSLPPTGRNRWA